MENLIKFPRRKSDDNELLILRHSNENTNVYF